ELAVGVDVIDPDPRIARGPPEIRIAQDLPVFGPRCGLDQRPERSELRRLARTGAVLRPLHAALARSAQDVEVAVAIPIDHEWVAVIALDLQRLFAGFDLVGLGQELAVSLPVEEVERAGEIADDQVEVAVAVPVDRERSGADIVDPVIPLAR